MAEICYHIGDEDIKLDECAFNTWRNASDSKVCVAQNITHCCLKYLSNNVCYMCSAGYTLTYSKTCVPTCVANCISCTFPYTCSECAEGYTSSIFACTKVCPTNCAECSNPTTCTKCNSGYQLNIG